MSSVRKEKSDDKSIPWEKFIRAYGKYMLDEEIAELGTGEGKFDTIYFAGSITERTSSDF